MKDTPSKHLPTLINLSVLLVDVTSPTGYGFPPIPLPSGVLLDPVQIARAP